ncbi:hypothetical protein ACP70R_021639 [Stipagrostis hirtigluma subsp. patula]
MGAPLVPVHVCTAEPLPHLSIKDIPLVHYKSELWELGDPVPYAREH